MQTFVAQSAEPKFLGAQSCSTSGCHGGADDVSKQFTVWSQRDFHYKRPVATLTTARSERIAEVLKIGDPTKSERCTACHAPIQTIPVARKAAAFKIEEGVSCENCHASAENWIRSHTRPDYTYEMRAASGMRDLKNLYVRANTCVACHQNVDKDILAAGHPELIFELDGQCVTMPKHWREKTNWHGAQVWLVGQVIALREMSWKLKDKSNVDPKEFARWSGLLALMRAATVTVSSLPPPSEHIVGENKTRNPDGEIILNFSAVQKWSDHMAATASKFPWSADHTKRLLEKLLQPSKDVLTQESQARRAERLVLGLDRLVADLGWSKHQEISPALDKLFSDVQSLPDFDAAQFGNDLKQFHASVSAILESK